VLSQALLQLPKVAFKNVDGKVSSFHVFVIPIAHGECLWFHVFMINGVGGGGARTPPKIFELLKIRAKSLKIRAKSRPTFDFFSPKPRKHTNTFFGGHNDCVISKKSLHGFVRKICREKSHKNFLSKFWSNSGKSLSRPQTFACSYTYVHDECSWFHILVTAFRDSRCLWLWASKQFFPGVPIVDFPGGPIVDFPGIGQ